MRYIVDAQLPRQLARWLQERGNDVIHTLDLPLRNRTPDSEINALSVRDQRIVITKDADFVNSFTLSGIPHKLLLISTGNIPNSELLLLFEQNIQTIELTFTTYDYVELSRTNLIIHR
jgi:predicted nuclease of predicted toxin-antitoxin system